MYILHTKYKSLYHRIKIKYSRVFNLYLAITECISSLQLGMAAINEKKSDFGKNRM